MEYFVANTASFLLILSFPIYHPESAPDAYHNHKNFKAKKQAFCTMWGKWKHPLKKFLHICIIFMYFLIMF